MKRIINWVLALVVVFGFMSNSSIRKKKWTLEDLVKNPKVEVQIKSNGEHAGESVIVEINSTFNHAITVKVPAGTLFIPRDEEEQTLVVPEQELISISPKQTKETLLSGYCTESRDNSPSKGGDFTLGMTSDKKLSKFFTYLKTNKVDPENLQESIWCITDNHSIGNIYVEDKKSNLKETLSKITGKKIPWQSTKRKLIINQERRIVPVPLLIKGDIVFRTTKLTSVKSKIIQENGELIHDNEKVMKIPKSNRVSLKFNIKVKGWKPGKYYVVYYTTEGRELVKQQFIV